jgi:hypothetical protein
MQQTYMKEGWKGFYRGLVPSLAKAIANKLQLLPKTKVFVGRPGRIDILCGLRAQQAKVRLELIPKASLTEVITDWVSSCFLHSPSMYIVVSL